MSIRFGFLFLLAISANLAESVYNWPTAFNYVMYAYSAYCQHQDLQNWSCFWCRNTTEKFTVTAIFLNDSTNTYGYAGYNDREIMITFRGTQISSLENWITNLESAEMSPYPNVPGAEVTLGFYDAYLGVRDSVLEAAKKLRTQFPHLPLVLNGHSLGGALSSMCAIDLAEQLGESAIVQWTWGSPRVGNSVFANYYTTKIETCWRTVNERDLVPHLPTLLEGFYHVPREVWFENNYYNFTLCDMSGEDPNCSDSDYFADSIYDHLIYLGAWHRAGNPYGC